MRRFRGTIIGLTALAAVYLGARYVDSRLPSEVPPEVQPPLFRFEKEDLVGVRIVRPDVVLELVREDGDWRVPGQPWRPSRSMVRRVAHQIHDLDARAKVVEDVSDPGVYGLGSRSITVELKLADGQTMTFEAGDPNPSSVSYYIRPLPGDTVYVVKKSAVDYYRLGLDEFREHRFATLDADDAATIDATVDGRRLRFERVDDKRWRMLAPVAQDASREAVRTMLGRTAALKAGRFVADEPDDATLTRYGLKPPAHVVAIGLAGGEPVTLDIGLQVPDTDPQERYVYRREDRAIYTAREGFLEAFQLPIEEYRRKEILGLYEWSLAAMTVRRGDESLRLTRTSDGWRWPDESPVPGSTPRRLASAAGELQAVAFHDTPPPPARSGLGTPTSTIELEPTDGSPRTVFVGAPIKLPTELRRYVAVDGDPVVYEVHDVLGEAVDDLFREFGRKKERDAEKRIRDEIAELPPEP